MTRNINAYHVDRRAFMVRAICLVLATGLPIGACSRIEGSGLTPSQLALFNEIAETMIPRTDTPSATEAGVPAFMSMMMQEWASLETVSKIRKVLTEIDAAAHGDLGKSFLNANSAQRTALLARLDEAWIVGQHSGYALVKELILTGYYWSEVGATKELRYDLVPGFWQGCIPLAANDRAWAV